MENDYDFYIMGKVERDGNILLNIDINNCKSYILIDFIKFECEKEYKHIGKHLVHFNGSVIEWW